MLSSTKMTQALEHINRAYRSSEVRVPLIVSLADGNPGPSIDFLARSNGSRVWSINVDGPSSETNVMDYLEVGLATGDHLLVTSAENLSLDTARKIGMTLVTLQPAPKTAPRREFFRLWLQVSASIPIDINANVKPLFPQCIMQHAIVCRVRDASAAASAAPSAENSPAKNADGSPARSGVVAAHPSPTKLMRRMAAEPPLLKNDLDKHSHRREVGRDSDSESDAEEAEKKVTGLWFHRNVEFFSNDKESSVEDYKITIFDAVDAQDLDKIKFIAETGTINIDTVKRDGMTPLQYAVSRQRTESVKQLLDLGADIMLRRESDGSPLLFMAIEDTVLLQHLLDGGADLKNSRFEGYLLEDHPLTAPHIAKLIKEMKRSGKL